MGTGFTERMLDELRRRLEPLVRERSPFGSGPKLPRESVFVEPCLVAEIEFTEWTDDGVMRAPSYKGLRDDKAPREVSLEVAPDGVRPTARGVAAGTPEALFDEVRAVARGRARDPHRRPEAEAHQLGQGPVSRERPSRRAI